VTIHPDTLHPDIPAGSIDLLCDRLAIIDRGRVVAIGPPDVVRGGHRSLEAAYLALTAPAWTGAA
jgi:ABC-type multidrug transport system ATPase subunit